MAAAGQEKKATYPLLENTRRDKVILPILPVSVSTLTPEAYLFAVHLIKETEEVAGWGANKGGGICC